MRESVLLRIEEARAVASSLEKTGQNEQAHAVERLAQELFQADARERTWRRALLVAIREIPDEEDR